MFLFCFSLVHETFRDRGAVVDQSVSVVFNCIFFFLCQTLIMCDIKMGLIDGLFGTCLPDMGSKDISARCKNKMGASMMSL